MLFNETMVIIMVCAKINRLTLYYKKYKPELRHI